MPAKLTFYGGVGATTGANILLEADGSKILVDCGLRQGGSKAELKNFEDFKYDPASIDFLLITHAHLDHVGLIPKLVRAGFRGSIVSTEATRELARPILEDALRVFMSRHHEHVLYDQADIEKTFDLWRVGRYGESLNLTAGVKLQMQNAGHILGSAILNVFCESDHRPIRVAFTGDLGNSPSPLLPDAEFPTGADYLVMESVYGDRNHESKSDRRERLKSIITETANQGRTLIIPVFSVERTQVLLYEINNLIEDREVPSLPVFFDSPLALKVTHIYEKYKSQFKSAVQAEMHAGDDIFDFPGLTIVRTAAESAELNQKSGPKIILSGSGMSEGGRVVGHEMHYLSDPQATILLVGYQSVGSLGRKLQDGVKRISPPFPSYIKKGKTQRTNRDNSDQLVRAKIETILGYSSHMDSEHLLEFVEKTAVMEDDESSRTTKLKKVFVIMGEPQSSLFLVQRLRDYLDLNAIYPEEAKSYLLS